MIKVNNLVFAERKHKIVQRDYEVLTGLGKSELLSVYYNPEYEGDVLYLKMLMNELNYMYPNKKKVLHIEFMHMPTAYAEPIEFKGYYAIVDMINNMGFDRVFIFDPINVGAAYAIKNAVVTYPDFIPEKDMDFVLFLSDWHNIKYSAVGLDVTKGKLIVTNVGGNLGIKGNTAGIRGSSVVLITDYVGTGYFVERVIKNLNKRGCTDIIIYVSRIESAGKKKLEKLLKHKKLAKVYMGSNEVELEVE